MAVCAGVRCAQRALAQAAARTFFSVVPALKVSILDAAASSVITDDCESLLASRKKGVFRRYSSRTAMGAVDRDDELRELCRTKVGRNSLDAFVLAPAPIGRAAVDLRQTTPVTTTSTR